MVFYIDSTGHLASVENYASSQIVTFRGLEYTAESRGELVPSGWMRGRVEGLPNIVGSTLKPISLKDIGSGPLAPPEAPSTKVPGDLTPTLSLDASPAPISKVAADLEPTPAQGQESPSDPPHAENTLSYTPGILQVSPAYSQAMDSKELSHLNEMLDRIQSMSISDDKTLVFDKIGLKANDREIYIPPTTT